MTDGVLICLVRCHDGVPRASFSGLRVMLSSPLSRQSQIRRHPLTTPRSCWINSASNIRTNSSRLVVLLRPCEWHLQEKQEQLFYVACVRCPQTVTHQYALSDLQSIVTPSIFNTVRRNFPTYYHQKMLIVRLHVHYKLVSYLNGWTYHARINTNW